MAFFNELLRRLAAEQGVYGGGDPIAQVEQWDCPAGVRAWRAWAEAEAAYRRGDGDDCLAWLSAAETWSSAAPETVRAAEIALLNAIFWNRLEEPRRAMPYAAAAWTAWFGFARNMLAAAPPASLRNLLDALIWPERHEMSDAELVMAWAEDRCSLNLHVGARQLIAACRMLRTGGPALELADELRDWIKRTTEGSGLAAATFGPVLALVLKDVADLHDALNEPQSALDLFEEALALTRGHPAATASECRKLEFNIANQLGTLGRHAAAVTEFERLEAAFADAGETEFALRARHAALVSRFHIDPDDERLRRDLDEVVLAFEAIIEEAGPPADAAARNLAAANALWASVAARRIGDSIPVERLVRQLMANREGGTRAHSLYARTAQDRPEQILDELALVLDRLSRLPADALVFSIDSGVGELIAVTVGCGAMPAEERIEVEILDGDCVAALTALIRVRRAAAEAIALGAMPASAPADADFELACGAFWSSLPDTIRARLSAAREIYFLPQATGALDETPLEIVHDGNGYLGLGKIVVRLASWRKLAQMLAPNRLDALPTGRLGLVRGRDVDELGSLHSADAEIAKIAELAKDGYREVVSLSEATSADFMALLNDGVDLLHFTGHSFADEGGEFLVLGPDEHVDGPQLYAPRSRPAPIAIFCSCLVGLHRSTRAGAVRGIASALLDGGAPAVVAATVELPDRVGRDFAVALHFHLRSSPIGEAVRAARLTLSRRLHPATWGCFALSGRPDARIPPEEPALPAWPALLIRAFASRGRQWSTELEAALAADDGAPPALRDYVLALLATLTGDGDRDCPEVAPGLLRGLSAEARCSLWAAENLVRSCAGDDGEASDALGRALLVRDIADDNYLLAAIADAGLRNGALLVQDANSTALVAQAERMLGWLDRSAEGLSGLAGQLREVQARWESQLTIGVGEFAGVSAETMRAADAGDRAAQKEMLWSLRARDASARAVASDAPWREWLYRFAGAEGAAAHADLCGHIDATEHAARLAPGQVRALRAMIGHYSGPGEIEPEVLADALDQFAGQPADIAAIALFALYDRITSQERPVDRAEIEQGLVAATDAGADGLAAFLMLQLAAGALNRREWDQAALLASEVAQRYGRLAEIDPVYENRFNLAAVLLLSVADASGDAELRAAALGRYEAQISAYLAASP